jgi:ADP-ribose pyrophosphatase
VPDWFTTVSSRNVHDGHVDLRVDTVRMPDGSEADREVAVPPDAVAVVALHDGDVVLVRQYRHPVGATTLELPAGVRDVEGESAQQTGARELAEECGLASQDWEELVTIHTSPGWSTETVTLFVARDCRPVDPPGDYEPHAEEAAMEVVRLPVEAALAAVRDGTISDAKAAIGLLLALAPAGDG